MAKKQPSKKKKLTIIGSCNVCGNPIYGSMFLSEGEEPVVKRSCLCVFPNYSWWWYYQRPYYPYWNYPNTITWGTAQSQVTTNTGLMYNAIADEQIPHGAITCPNSFNNDTLNTFNTLLKTTAVSDSMSLGRS